MTWNNSNKKHYISKGYEFTKNGDKFLVDVNDLSKGSQYKVDVICDSCGTVKTMAYCDYLRCHKKHNIDLCKSCQNISATMTWQEKYGVSHPRKLVEIKNKAVQTNLQKYGCENPMQNPDVKDKGVNTMMERYGVSRPLQYKEFHDKAEQSCLDKYGVANAFQSEEIKNKIKKINLQKYGVENIQQCLEVREKTKQTNLQKYGCKNPMQNSDVQAKARQTLYENNTVPTSKPEKQCCELLKEIYGAENCIDSYPFGSLNFDCLVKVDGELIDFEYDGWYWHKNKQQQDRRRNYFVIRNGFKVLRIRANKDIPTKQQLIDAVDYLIKENHHLKIIELDI